MYRLEVHDSIGAVAAAAWDQLIVTAGAPVFYRHDLLAGYERSGLGAQAATRYLVARDQAGALTAALPLYLLDAREIFTILGTTGLGTTGLGTTGLGTTRFADAARRALLSHFPHCYDTTVPRAPGTGVALRALWAAMLAEARRCGARLCGLFNVESTSRLADELAAATGVAAAPCGARWLLEPAAFGHLDNLLAAMARSTRRTLRLARNRAIAAGASIDARRGGDQDLDDVVALCAATAAKHGNGYYPPQPMRVFLRRTGDRLLVLRVRLGATTLAASVCLHDGDVLHCWAGGTRRAKVLNWSPNHVLFHAELALAFELGVKRAEFGRRSDEFKARHRLSRRPLVAYLWEL